MGRRKCYQVLEAPPGIISMVTRPAQRERAICCTRSGNRHRPHLHYRVLSKGGGGGVAVTLLVDPDMFEVVDPYNGVAASEFRPCWCFFTVGEDYIIFK